MCLSPVHNVFFYPFPFIAFGAHDIGETFQSMQIVVLVHPVTFICAISPSPLGRGTPDRLAGTSPWQRCYRYSFECHKPTEQEIDAKMYDNCIDPSYQERSGVRGWMAIADLDSFQSKKLLESGLSPKEFPMSKYIRHLQDVLPGKAAELLALTYTDRNRRDGYPELAIYPYKTHRGPRRIVNGVCTSSKAIQLIEKEIRNNNLNFLPLAVFTKDSTVDMVKGRFMWETLGVARNSFATPPVEHQLPIEKRLNEYMDLLQSSGVDLPFYGKGKLSFDSRTGFFVLPQLIPKHYKLPVPDDKNGIPYSFVVMPLDSDQARKNAMTYTLMFRTPIPQKFMEKYGLEKGVGVRRAMIFSRPPVLSKLFEALDLPIPPSYKATLGRAAKQYQLNTGILSKAQQARIAEKTKETKETAQPQENQYLYQPTTPPYAQTTPPYAQTTPPYAETTPPYAQTTPPYAQTTPPKGGKRSKQTRRIQKQKVLKTRRVSHKPFLHFATDFKRIWEEHAKQGKANYS